VFGGFVWRRRASFRKATAGENRDPVEFAELGTMTWDSHGESWIARVHVGERSIAIHVAGEPAPHEELVRSAQAIVRDLDAFLARTTPVLEQAASEVPEAASEILGLRAESICVPWRDRPNDGMIYFDGPGTDERVWRCDFIEGVPQALGFDD